MVSYGTNCQGWTIFPCEEELSMTIAVCHRAAVVLSKKPDVMNDEEACDEEETDVS